VPLPNLNRVPRPNLIERRLSKFLREPPSVRAAASVIVAATAVIVVAGGVLFRVFDHHEYPNIWIGMWLAIQTVTTVGYGDITPKDVIGRLIAMFIMLEGVAFIAIVTAAVTSSFVARAERERAIADAGLGEQEAKRIDARFDTLEQRLDNLDSMLRNLSNDRDP